MANRAHKIEIVRNDAGLFDVLVNGHSYRIHRDQPDFFSAQTLSSRIAADFRAIGERAVQVGQCEARAA